MKALSSQSQGLGSLGDIVAEMFQSLADDLAFIIIHQTLKGTVIPVKRCFWRERSSGSFFCALLFFQKIGGKVLQPYGISVSQILGIVQNMEQFPDISRPGIALEEFHYLIVQGSGAVDILIGSSRQVVLDQFIQILHVHAERRKLDHNSRETVEEILPELIGVGEAGTDVKIAVLSFSSGCEWVTPEPVLVEEYQRWENLRADGVTDLGEACEELSRKLSRNGFLRSPSLSYAPVIFLLTDGYPTDNYKKGFEMLKKNRWFQYGLKIALAIGSNVDMEVLQEFTDDEELVLQACGAEMLRKLVREIAVTSSKIGSTSMTLTDAKGERSVEDVAGAKKEQMVEAVQEIRQDVLGVDDLEDLDDLDIEFDEGW